MKEQLKLQNQLCFPLYTASRLITQLYVPLLQERDLTYPQYLVMMALWEKDGLSVGSIGELLYLDSGTLTPLLKKLEKSGLVLRVRNPEDEREVIITLTKQGLQLQKWAEEIPQKMVCSLGIKSHETKSYQEMVRKLVKMAEQGLLTAMENSAQKPQSRKLKNKGVRL